MRASARLEVTSRPGRAGKQRTTITGLRSDPPLVLRPTHPVRPEPLQRWGLGGCSTARVSLVSGAAGPVGGDELRLDVEVGRGAVLVLRAVAASVVLPGPHGAASSLRTRVRVGRDATLVWLPGQVIAAQGCKHEAVTHIDLDDGARLLVREELLLGRHAEQPGSIRQRLRVTLAGRPLHDQELAVGSEASGWAGPAVTGGRRATGTVLVVDPELDRAAGQPIAGTATDSGAVLPLAGPAVLLTALANDAHALRQRLDCLVARLECPS
jgi:urease accessory protein